MPAIPSTHARAVIFANGLIPDLDAARSLVRLDDFLLAADGGTRHLLKMGLVPAVVIGDLDSLTSREKAGLEEAGCSLIVHPRDKDATDLELALDHALRHGYRCILVVGALGGRLDQTLGNLTLLSGEQFSGLDVRLDDGCEEVFFARSNARIEGKAGDIVSLLPWGGPATGITTEGLQWPLRGETLLPERTRGISNAMMAASATITLDNGLLLVTHRRSG